MDLHVTLAGRGDLSARIYRQLHDAIVDGTLRAGDRLPPTRDLARQLDVSRNTVAVAYERLTAEGFLVGRVGAGTFVAATPVGPAGGRAAAPARAVWRTVGAQAGPRTGPPAFDFAVGMPDLRRFPLTLWRRAVARQLQDMSPSGYGYGDADGDPALRAEIARHVGLSRSVRVNAEDVLVTQGAQQALDLVARVLVEPGACVAVEEPGYPPARELFASFGARVVGVGVDGEGLDVSALPRSARLVYTTPSHQFPLGPPMSLARRAALLAWAARVGAIVVEDDYDSEFRFADRPLEPLHGLDRGERVVYVGSFSKTMLPALRLGFLVAPASLLPALRAAKRLAGQGDPVTQGALARFLADGSFVRHLRRSAREYAARRALIIEVLGRDFAGLLDVAPATAGLHLAAWLPSGVDAGELVRRAAAEGVAVENLAAYHAEGPGAPGLAIGYGGIALDRIEPGLARLRDALR